jgi:hypothetical protein
MTNHVWDTPLNRIGKCTKCGLLRFLCADPETHETFWCYTDGSRSRYYTPSMNVPGCRELQMKKALR